MIGYVKGKIIAKGRDFLIVGSNGVGYKVFVSKNTLTMSEKKAEIEFFTWPYLKRETIELYGCPSEKEFEVFQVLEKMSGIGPKTALSLASFGSLEKLKKALEQKDDKLFVQVKGMGQKRLQRLMLELTGKVGNMEKKDSFPKDEAFQALVSLGFPKKSIESALSQVPENVKDLQKRIKQALKFLSGA